MEWRAVGILCCGWFILWMHRGAYPRPHIRPGASRRELVEALAIVAALLLLPHLRLSMLWYTDWLGPYLMLGLWAPYLMEILLRGRSLTLIGVAKPLNLPKLQVVGYICGLFLLSKIVDPLSVAAGPYGVITWSWSTILVFPLVEEVLFRGLLQTRLEALMGTARAWLCSGALFGAYHYYVNHLIPGRPPTPEQILSLVYLAAFGMLLGAMAAKTRSLLPSFLVHALNNLTL